MRGAGWLLACLVVLPGCLAPAPGPAAAGLVDPPCAAPALPWTPLGPFSRRADPGAPPAGPAAPAGSLAAVERDAFGVPRLRAADAAEAWRTLGYLIAEDRLWQLELKRRAATGTLAEVRGPVALDADVLARARLAADAEMEARLAALGPSRANVEAHLDGMNRRIAEVLADPRSLPAEFAATGVPLRPWTLRDLHDVAWGASGARGSERPNVGPYLALLDAFDEAEAVARFNDLVPVGTRGAPTTIPPGELRYTPRPLPLAAYPDQVEALRAAAPLFEHLGATPLLPDPVVEALQGRHGSNAVVVAGTRTASGAPLLLGGPQVGFTTPATYWEAVLDFDDVRWNVFIKPAEPWLRGFLGSMAYVQTTAYADQLDLVLLRLDSADPGRYLFGDASMAFDARVEAFAVGPPRPGPPGAAPALPDPAGVLPGAPPAPAHLEVVRRSHLGPVVAHDPALGYALVEQTVDLPAGGLTRLWLSPELPALSRDPAALRAAYQAAIDDSPAAGNTLAAFADGVIGYWSSGAVPLRAPGYDWRLPRLGGPGTDWQGLRSPLCAPRVLDPAQGYLVNWNNPSAAGFDNLDVLPWTGGGSHRVDALEGAMRAALAAGPLDPAGLEALHERVAQRDVYAHHVVPGLAALAGPDPLADAAAAWVAAGAPIRDDDGDGRVDHPGLAAFEAWRTALQERIFGDELGEANHAMRWGSNLQGGNYDDHGTGAWSESVLRALLAGEVTAGWWDDVGTPQAEDAPAIVRASLDQARAALAETLGPDPGDWHPPMPRIQYTPLGLGPALSAPLQNRGSINYVVDFHRGSVATIVPPGEVGHVGLGGLVGGAPGVHVADQLEPFVRFGFKPPTPFR